MPHQKRPSTFSPLLSDGVRVLSGTLAEAKRGLQVVSALARHVLRDRTRRAKRQIKQILAAARQPGTAAGDWMQTAPQHLLDIARAPVQPAPRGGAVLKPRAPRRARNWPGQRVMSLPIRAIIPDVGSCRECRLLPEGLRTEN
jgi:hypothetical protein